MQEVCLKKHECFLRTCLILPYGGQKDAIFMQGLQSKFVQMQNGMY